MEAITFVRIEPTDSAMQVYLRQGHLYARK